MIRDQFIATYPDGSQDLITLFADGSGEIASRRNQHATWGIPTELREQVYA